MTTPTPATAPATVPFSKLVASDTVNARGATKEGLDELAASIAAKGLIQPLSVRLVASDSAPGGRSAPSPAVGLPSGRGRLPAGESEGAKYEIIDGRRRHAAIARLVKAKAEGWGKATPIPVLVRDEDDATALETSLMANTVRLPMHPVDQFEVFARLADQGKAPAEIAASFGIAEKTVRQQQALGKLAPVVRDAWRKGKIAPETARAFALHDNPEVQAATFERLKKQGSYMLSEHAVRNALAQKRQKVSACAELLYVGEDAYLEAGGTLSESLFEDERTVDDVPLAEALARAKLDAECRRLVAEDGWAWAEVEADDEGGLNSWDCDNILNAEAGLTLDDHDDPAFASNVDKRLAELTPAQRAKSGCLVELLHGGAVKVHPGLLKPAPEHGEEGDGEGDDDAQTDLEEVLANDGDAPDDGDDERGDEAPGHVAPSDDGRLSQALLTTLTTAQTEAVGELVQRDFELALRVALATLLASDWSAPCKITITGEALKRPDKAQFDKVWPRVFALSYGELMTEFAHVLAGSLSLVEKPHVPSARAGSRALVASLPHDKYGIWMREAFNAADFFKRSPKAVALAAIEEMRAAGWASGVAPAEALAQCKKPDLAETAADAAVDSGWLPAALRHPRYELLPPSNTSTKEAAE